MNETGKTGKTLLVGFGNKARHGKDYVANEVHALLPRETRLYSFASSLKAVARVLGMRAKDGPLLQALGTDVFRKIDPDIWVRVLKYQIEEEAPKCALITDCRFPNEANYIHNSGGILVRVVRLQAVEGFWKRLDARYMSKNWFDSILPVEWVSSDRDPKHPSEVALDDYPFDVTIRAMSGNLGHLIQQAEGLAGLICRELEVPATFKHEKVNET